MEIKNSFWGNKHVLVTGHTGFKGSWLSIWLRMLGAKVSGLSLDPIYEPNLFSLFKLSKNINDFRGDIKSIKACQDIISSCSPDIIIHMAAQPLVRQSYRDPSNTFETNMMGTINILEAARNVNSLKSIIIITSDKCYDNIEKKYSYKEADKLGGYDPYSASKACVELIVNSYWKSFFREKSVGVASVRAGNVVGGGDWSKDRLVPDIFNAFSRGDVLKIRNQFAIRPWQHVLEPLYGYLILCEKTWRNDVDFSGAWNFGPDEKDCKTVKEIVEYASSLWGGNAKWIIKEDLSMHEAMLLQLDSSKAKTKLKWKSVLNWREALEYTILWYKEYDKNSINIPNYTSNQIIRYHEKQKDRY